MKIFVLLAMLFCHIVDDFYLQGILAQMKQKEWWQKYGSKYEYDYIVALIMHGFSWAFMIMLPAAIYTLVYVPDKFHLLLPSYIFNAIGHTFIDNEKANKKTINLIIDQSFHIIQIALAFTSFLTTVR